tara:strand:- start:26 stop:250 length:225 start_codon:yes stop_codon:yes gene_type:complete
LIKHEKCQKQLSMPKQNIESSNAAAQLQNRKKVRRCALDHRQDTPNLTRKTRFSRKSSRLFTQLLHGRLKAFNG